MLNQFINDIYIKNITIRNSSDYGVYIYRNWDIFIDNISISESRSGFYIFQGGNKVISNFIVNKATVQSINFGNSERNVRLENGTIKNSNTGINFKLGTRSSIAKNITYINNSRAIYFEASSENINITNSIFTNNSVNIEYNEVAAKYAINSSITSNIFDSYLTIISDNWNRVQYFDNNNYLDLISPTEPLCLDMGLNLTCDLNTNGINFTSLGFSTNQESSVFNFSNFLFILIPVIFYFIMY